MIKRDNGFVHPFKSQPIVPNDLGECMGAPARMSDEQRQAVGEKVVREFVDKMIADGILPAAPYQVSFVHDEALVDFDEPEPDKPITVRIAE